MKTHKNIFISVIFLLTVSLSWGLSIVDRYSHITNKIENLANTTHESLISSESSIEEDVPVVLSPYFIQFVNTGNKSIPAFACLFPSNLYYSIWQPPKIS